MKQRLSLLFLFAAFFAEAASVYPIGGAFSRKSPYVGEKASLFLEVAVPVDAELLNVSLGGLPPSICHGEPPLAERRQVKGGDGNYYEIFKISYPVFAKEPVTLNGGKLRFSGMCKTREFRVLSFSGESVRPFDVQIALPETTFRELPSEGRPGGFGGAIGQFGLSSEIDETNPEIGGVISLVYTLSGGGERGKSQISFPEFDKKLFRAYSPEPIAGTKEGSESFSIKIVPMAAGHFELPQASFSFFDPESECYHTVYSGKAAIDVRKKSDCSAPSVRTISLGKEEDTGAEVSPPEGIVLYLAPSVTSLRTFVIRQDDIGRTVERTDDGQWEKVESAKTGRRGWRKAVK